MKIILGRLNKFVAGVAAKAKVRKGTLTALGIFFVLQLYFVRELLAAELLFALAFGVLLIIGGTAYALGAIGERGLDLAEAGIRVLARSARRGYGLVDELSRKSFRHARSESAQ
ncbi:MAG TPA: hypothetical protein VN884_08825 [Candidatus Sulfotelmatobacter sp.]|jgi:hypothetical protein|nr:hypothetical protein [Candidatus Sulfotelmatobacter sp.]